MATTWYSVQVDPLKRHDAGGILKQGGVEKMRIRGAKIIQLLICWVLGFRGYLRAAHPLIERFDRIVNLAPGTAKYTPVIILTGGRLSRGPTHLIRRTDF